MQTVELQPTALVHQILMVDGFGLPLSLPPLVVENIDILGALYPSARYRLWDGQSLREMIASNFEREVLQAFETLVPYSFKSDLARYCLLYLYGGLYVDLGMRCLNPLRPPPGVGLASFKDYDLLSPSWVAVAGGITWATPRRNEFRIAIDYVLENCRNKYYGSNPLYPTGPVVFGRALIAAMAAKKQGADADDQWIGVSRPLTPGKQQENIGYIAPDHSLIAMRIKRTGGDLSHLGLSGVNNYNIFWHRGQIYREREIVWTFDDPAIRLTKRAIRTATGIAAISDHPGTLTYGPYIDLAPGKYRVKVSLLGNIVLPQMAVDVAHDSGQHVICVRKIAAGPRNSPATIELEFEAAASLQAVEFRTEIFGAMKGEIVRFSIEAIDCSS
jgi:Glycosyltransferase sugar-binding region containing DXD motif